MASTGNEHHKSGERLDVYITHVKVNRELGQVNFWAQLDPVGAEDLEELDILIQEKAEADPYPPEPKSLLVGEPCLANFIEDSRWYRARVEQCTENDVIAYFMDYGNTEIIPFNLIRRADSSVFASLRAQATECILEGVNVGDKPGTLAYLKKLLADQSFVGKPAGFIAGRVHMTLQMESESREVVADRIVREGFGTPAKTRIPGDGRAGGDAKIEFKEMGLDVGSREKLYISYVESPSAFWIQQSCISRDLDNLMNDLMGFYCDADSQAEVVKRAEEGMACVALFSEDETFYRAVVEKVLANNKCRVCFVDYGNSEVTSVSNLRVLTPEFLKLPTIGIKCCLSGIEEASCTSPEATARFEELTSDKELCGKVVGFKADRCAILLVDPNGKENADIAGVLVKEGLAKRDQDQFPSKGSRRVVERAAPMAANAPRSSGLPVNQVPVSQSYTVSSLKLGSKHEVQVTSVASISNISCQLLKDAEAFDEMMTNLQDAYSSAGGNITSPVVNQPCCSQFTEDDSWYRAKITAVKGSNVDVTYIDYGNSETLPVSRLRVLKSQFFQLPQQSITCSLQGITSDEANTTKAKEHFEEITSEKTYTASITDIKAEAFAVVLMETDIGTNVNKEMSKFLQSSRPSSRGQLQNSQPENTQPRGQQGFGQRPPQDQPQQGFGQRSPKDPPQQGFGQKTPPRNQQFQQNAKSPPRNEQPMNHQEKPAPMKQASSPARPSAPAEAASYTEAQLPSGETSVYLSHGNNPLEIWCQPVKSSPQLEKFMEEVYNKYSTQSVPTLKSIAVGTPCMALFDEDEGWYRAVVVNKHVGELEVLFVDYGNSARVKMQKVKMISPELMKLPTQAVKCALKGWGDAGKAAPQVIAKMKELAAKVDQFKCECRGSSGGVYEIELMWERKRMSEELKKIQAQAVKERKQKQAAAAAPPAQQRQTTPQAAAAPTGLIISAVDDIKLNAHEDFIVSHVDNPARFWCQPAKTCQVLDDIMVKINNHYTGSSGDALENVSVGGFCISKYLEDDGWYRAQILKTISVSQVEVHFIDYGNTDKVDVSNLRKLRPEFSNLKSQAVQCALEGHVGDDYQQDLITKFEELVLEKQLVGDVKAKRAGMIALELFDTTGAKDVNINQEIKGIMGAQGGSNQSASVITGYPHQTFPKGFESEVYATHIEGVHQFYVQESSKTEAIETMSAQLQDAYASVGPSDLQLSHSEIGQPCCAQFTEDEQWYRAIVTDKPAPGRARVCFVDFGNSEEQDVTKLKAVKPEFLNQESLAIECRLGQCRAGVPKALEKFETSILDKPIRCVFHGNSSSPYGVTLYDGDTDINKEISSVVGDDAKKMATDGHGSTSQGGDAGQDSLQMTKPSTWTGKTFPREQLNESIQDVKVINAASPDQFFVQPLHFLELIGDLMKEIEAFTESVLSVLVLPDWQMSAQIGMPCLVQNTEDDKWCRAEIIDIVGSGKADVMLVDAGVQQTVDMSVLRPISAKLVAMHALVIECKLKSVIPANDAANWDAAVCDVFREITLDRTMGVEMGEEGIDLYTEDKESISLKLIELGIAVDPATVKEQAEAAAAAAMEAAAIEAAAAVGDELVLYFLSANGPTDFVCQPASTADSLAELMDNLAAHYEEALNQTGVAPVVGQQCVAKFTEDDGWYRACVEAVNGDDVTVLYIDYGNSEVLPKTRLCKIQPQFTELVAQAITYKVTPTLIHLSEWNEDVKALLDESCAERELHVTLVDKSPTIKLGQEDVTFIKTSLQDSLPLVKEVEQVALGESVSLSFLSVDGPSTVTCQPMSTADDLIELMDNIAAFYEDESNKADFTPEVEKHCVAQFTEDDGWYRATVTAIDDTDITVLYTDYGNSENLSQDRLRAIQPQFEELAAQAINYQVMPALMHTSQWTDDVKAIIDEACAEREIKAHLVGSSDAHTIQLSQEDLDFIKASVADILPPVAEEEKETDGINDVVDALVKTAISDALEEMTIPANITSAAGISVLSLFDKVTECLLQDELKEDTATEDVESKEEDMAENVKKMVEDVLSKAVEQICQEDGVGDTTPQAILDELIEMVATDLQIGAATEILEGDDSGETKTDEEKQVVAENDTVKEDGAEDEESPENPDVNEDDDESDSQDDSDDDARNALTDEVHPSPHRKRQKSGGEVKNKDEADFELEVNEEAFNFVAAEEDTEIDYSPESKKPKKEGGGNQCIMGCGTDEEEEEQTKEEEEQTKEEEEQMKEEEDKTKETEDDEEVEDEDFEDAEGDEVVTEITSSDNAEGENVQPEETRDDSETQVEEIKEDSNDPTEDSESKESKDEVDQEESFESAPSSPEREADTSSETPITKAGGDVADDTSSGTPNTKVGGDVVNDAPVVNGATETSTEPIDDSA